MFIDCDGLCNTSVLGIDHLFVIRVAYFHKLVINMMDGRRLELIHCNNHSLEPFLTKCCLINMPAGFCVILLVVCHKYYPRFHCITFKWVNVSADLCVLYNIYKIVKCQSNKTLINKVILIFTNAVYNGGRINI